MNLIKLDKKTGDKIEQLKLIIDIYSLLKGVKITNDQKVILSYFCYYGINSETEELLYKCKIITSKLTYRNTLSKFKKMGFIAKDIKRRFYVCDNVLNSIEDKIAILIKIDNSL